MADSPMWCIVMFDLPVQTKRQRTEATRFRKFLIDRGFSMLQFSVYNKYWPTGGVDRSTIRAVKDSLPPDGSVRILSITDRQWSSSYRFEGRKPDDPEDYPEQLTIF